MLCQVLALAKGYLRLFLGEGEALETLLRSLVPHVREQPILAYLQAILSAFDTQRTRPARPPIASGPATLIEDLFPKERQVLRLLAAGLSREEIAELLVISLNAVNMVKIHVRRIYQKLHVTNRVQAVEMARRVDVAR
jgi:LuxR family maltose regulon positive regulatory protein